MSKDITVTYHFVFQNRSSSCGEVLDITRQVLMPSKNLLKKIASEIIKEHLEDGKILLLLEAHPSMEMIGENMPTLSRHGKDDHLYGYQIILANIHENAETRLHIVECSKAPYVLNAKRIECVIKDYLQEHIKYGWELVGIVCTGEKSFYTPPVADRQDEQSGTSSKNDETEYVWVKVKDGDDCVNWIPARKSKHDARCVASFIGLMFSETPEEDTRSFTDCPIPGYTVTVAK